MFGVLTFHAALLSTTLRADAEVVFPTDFTADVRNSVLALVPASAHIVLEVDASFLGTEHFSVSCTGNVTSVKAAERRGLLFGLYSLLRRGGYGFLHPWKPIVPRVPQDLCMNFKEGPNTNGRHGTPLLGAVRGSHVHTQHPLELTNVLNGFASDASYDNDAAWADGLPAWTSYLQWLVANGQNFVEWCLLDNARWTSFSVSDVRQERLKTVIQMAHDWGLRVAIDAPINLAQQHAWRLQPKSGGDFRPRLSWLVDTGVDAVSTEIGTTEFSHTAPNTTLDIINEIVEYLAQKGKELIVKNHASTGQYAKGLKDPLHPDMDINFNFLTYYANQRVVNAPHTVQMYSLDDPLMGSYGRSNYTDMHEMMRLFQREERPAIYFPETAYWVDFDTTVPLFLPLYAADRLLDIQLLNREMPDMGHLNFESGHPFGYWFSNTVQAVAAWSSGGEMDFPTVTSALLAPLPGAAALAAIVTDLVKIQNQTLVYDKFLDTKGRQQTLMAYLQGYDGMNEFQEAWNFAVVQPQRTNPRELDSVWFNSTLQPRLQALADAVAPLSSQSEHIRKGLVGQQGAAEELTRDLCIGVELFALRVQQVIGVYTAAAARAANKERAFGLAQSHDAIVSASQLIGELRLDASVTNWTGLASPTAYPFGYLWPASTLFFWRRDHQIVDHGITEECYLNLYDPIEVGLAAGGNPVLKLVAKYGSDILKWMPWLKKWASCLSGPKTSPPTPLDPLSDNGDVEVRTDEMATLI